MALQTSVYFEVEKNGRKYLFYIPAKSPIGEVYDAAFEVLMDVAKLANESASKVKRAEESEEVASEEISEA